MERWPRRWIPVKHPRNLATTTTNHHYSGKINATSEFAKLFAGHDVRPEPRMLDQLRAYGHVGGIQSRSSGDHIACGVN